MKEGWGREGERREGERGRGGVGRRERREGEREGEKEGEGGEERGRGRREGGMWKANSKTVDATLKQWTKESLPLWEQYPRQA